MAFTDDLTGILNRRGFYLFANQLLQVALRQKAGFILLLADLDDLKEINDQYGHLQGDSALIRSAHLLKGRFRTSDLVARIGGDEFAVALLAEDGFDPHALQTEIKEMSKRRKPGDLFPYEPPALSVGFSVSGTERRLSLEAMMREADLMMYRNKTEKQPDAA